ncbi:MAG: hypothetical protein K2Q06_12605 [Parvularculaceae bacterium]|nr:hypothetical protein [Parvularculaceae bacterium]
MPRMQKAAIAAIVLSTAAAGYVAGAAHAAGSEAANKLNQAHDLLTKARAVLGATQSNRMGYGNVEKAKAAVDVALSEVEKAVAANGG